MSTPDGAASRLGERVAPRITELRGRGLHREERIPSRAIDAPLVFCSNDYLGLASDPALAEAGAAAMRALGMGAGASRLVSGTFEAHRRLERTVAGWLGAPDSLVFGSGYQANVGLLSALAGPDDLVVSDEWNHASLIDGMRLSRAKRVVVRHGDVEAFDRALRANSARGVRYVVTEAIFSMDGDRAALSELCDVAERHGAFVVVDEAHALGVVGPDGAGLTAALGEGARVAVRVGTFSKACGAFGAFVACDPVVRDLLYNGARSFVFATAPPPAWMVAIEAAVTIVREGARTARLWERTRSLAAELHAAGLGSPESESPIFPLVVGSESAAVALSQALLDAGFLVHPIRPPTVPPGTSRLRVTASAGHPPEANRLFVEALVRAAGVLGVEIRRGVA